MQQALLVRLRPLGPWRYGPSDGARDRVDTLFRSDRLFSAVTLALRQLGLLDAWLDATARSGKPAVAFSSLFPFQGDILYVTPPAHLWPPPSSLVTSPSPVFLTKVRWRAAHFVPLTLVDSLLTGQSVLADQWIPDPESGCLLRRDRPSSSPFRTVARTFAPIDRVNLTAAGSETSACVEFEPGSGLWTVLRFRDDAAHDTWNEPLRAAFRLLGDTGFGGGRSRGWGQLQAPEFENGTWPALLLPKVGRSARNDRHEEQTSRSYYLLSVYSPASTDVVNWSGGQYELSVRNGRVEGVAGQLKKSVRMVMEGCILDAAAEPLGAAVDVAPSGLPHPVYRSGIALALLVPPPKPQSEDRRAIEEIVPPELEATPFPMPPALTTEPSGAAEETHLAPVIEPPAVESTGEALPTEEISRETSRSEAFSSAEGAVRDEPLASPEQAHEPAPDNQTATTEGSSTSEPHQQEPPNSEPATEPSTEQPAHEPTPQEPDAPPEVSHEDANNESHPEPPAEHHGATEPSTEVTAHEPTPHTTEEQPPAPQEPEVNYDDANSANDEMPGESQPDQTDIIQVPKQPKPADHPAEDDKPKEEHGSDI